MTDRATLVASLTSAPDSDRVESLASQADVLELRADLAGTCDPDRLRGVFPGRLLYTLRSSAEGGAFSDRSWERRPLLMQAARGYDLVDLEAERDLHQDVLAAVPAERRLISWHGSLADSSGLGAILDRMTEAGAAYYKLVPAARSAIEASAPLLLLRERQRADVVAFASGRAGVWTRLVAPRLGSALVYGAVGERPAAAGQPSLQALRTDYGLPELRPAKRLFGVVGAPVEHSLSPRLHNGLYAKLGVEALYVPFHVREFGPFWLEFVETDLAGSIGYPLHGFSVTSPHKRIALAVAGASSPLAGRIGAANTLVRRRGVWEAEATDAEGVVLPLLDLELDLRGSRVAVVGVGGAGLSAAVGIEHAGAKVRLFNRTAARAERAAKQLGMSHAPIERLDASKFDILVNATPLGREDTDARPFDVARIVPHAVVVDMVYKRDGATPLAAAARRRGLTVVDGREILLHQAGQQFRMMTGREFPLEEGRRLLAQ